MNFLRNLEDGCATKINILLKGEEVEFKLAVVEKEEPFQSRKFYFLYINQERKLAMHGTYSGGITGAGQNPYSIEEYGNPGSYYNKIKVITTDLKRISEMAAEEAARLEKKQQELEDKKKQAVKDINDLPQFYTTNYDCITIARDDAFYHGSQSSSIKGAHLRLLWILPKDNKYYKYWNKSEFHVGRFISEDEKCLVAKFKKTTEYLIFKELYPEGSERIFLENLYSRARQISNGIRNMKNVY